MEEYLKLAWRNIWRNKRRTIITISSVFFAMFFALVMRGLQVGSYSHWTDSIVQAFTGYIQIHHKGYWDDQTLENTFVHVEELQNEILATENVSRVIPRLESFALASTGEKTKGILVVGIDPEKELDLTHPDRKIEEGQYLDQNPNGVMVSGRLAEFLNLELNDTLTLLSQGYHGVSAAGIYPVIAIMDIPNPQLDSRLVYLSIETAQQFYGAYDRLTSYVLNLEDQNKLESTVSMLRQKLDPDAYEVMDWKELNPEIVQQIQSDQASGYIMLALLYLIVGFGVLGTLIMMTNERKREFAVMVAVGMQKTRLGGILTIEMFIMGFLGIITGIAGSLPVILYLQNNPIHFKDELAHVMETYGMEPIMPATLEIGYLTGQSLVVLVLFVCAILYPIYSVVRLNETKALRA